MSDKTNELLGYTHNCGKNRCNYASLSLIGDGRTNQPLAELRKEPRGEAPNSKSAFSAIWRMLHCFLFFGREHEHTKLQINKLSMCYATYSTVTRKLYLINFLLIYNWLCTNNFCTRFIKANKIYWGRWFIVPTHTHINTIIYIVLALQVFN